VKGGITSQTAWSASSAYLAPVPAAHEETALKAGYDGNTGRSERIDGMVAVAERTFTRIAERVK
jgi:hypothetical protein